MSAFRNALLAAISGGGFLNLWSLMASLVVSLTFMGPYFAPVQGIGLLSASVLSWAILALLLLPVAWLERGAMRATGPSRVVLLAVAVTLAAAARPWLIDVVLAMQNLPTTPRELLVSRMITNVIVWWMLLITIAMLRNQVRGLRELNRRFGEVAESMRADAEAIAGRVREARAEIVRCQIDLEGRLETALQSDRHEQRAAGLLEFSNGPVREWSRTLSSFALVSVEPVGRGVRGRSEVQPRFVLRSWRRLRLPPVGSVALVYLVLALPYGIRELRPGLTLTIVAVLAICGGIADWAPRSMLARAPARQRFLCFVLIWLAAAVITSAMVIADGAVPLYLAWFPIFVIPMVALVCGWSAGLLHGLTAEGNRLESMIRRRRLQLVEGAAVPQDALRLAAGLLHREVQSSCLLYAASDSDATARRESLSRVRESISELAAVFDRAENTGAGMAGIEAMISAWSGVIDVRSSFEAAALELIDSTPALARHVSEIVAEGLVNTVKHADKLVARISIRVLATGAGKSVLVEVRSPGTLVAGARIRADSAVGLLGGELAQEAAEVRLSASFAAPAEAPAVVSTAHFSGAVTS